MEVQNLTLALTLGGLLIHIYGITVAFKFRKELEKGKLAKAWNKMLAMITLFIIGYLTYAGQIITDITILDPELVTGILFFTGAIFVAATAKLNYDVYSV